MEFVMSYSGGKDSALALYRMIEEGHTPVALLTTVNRDQERSWFHGIGDSLLQAVSESLHIPLLACVCTADNYNQSFEESLKKARELGAEACVFGDIDIEEHKSWDQDRCRHAGLRRVLPLWQQSREELVYEALRAGFRAKIKIVNGSKLDPSYLGQDLSLPLLAKMKEAGVDICGENGEYHTFVYDGPIFSFPVPFVMGEVVELGNYRAVELRKKGAE